MKAGSDFGIYGLGQIGGNLALNAVDKGISCVAFSRSETRRASFTGSLDGAACLVVPDEARFVAALRRPRVIILALPAGSPVDESIERLAACLEAGDIVVDSGDSWFRDTERRAGSLALRGIDYVGLGLSGDATAARRGPAFMAGGSTRAQDRLMPLLSILAARGPDGNPCCAWVGPGPSGHFVKMVHNAIEYADMELLAEAYHLLKSSLRATHDEMRTIFARWDQSELSSHLLSMVVDILGVREPDGSPLIDRVLDRAAQRGTGILAIESALDLGVPAGILAGAVFARSLSVLKDERIAASAILGSATSRPSGDRKTMIEDVRKALLSAKIIAYAEGFALLRRASLAWDWDLQLGQIARVWREGAVIGSPFLDDVADALDREPSASSLLLDARIKVLLDKTLIALRKTVARAVETGLALPVFTAAIVAYDGLRSPWLPANLIQAMRDRFGGTGFERIDRPRGEIYRHPWK